MTTPQLKTCPFCGAKPRVFYTTSGGYSVECINPSCPTLPTTWAYTTEDEAIENWNTREEKSNDN